ncbi:MAG TPA: hypothetical protein VK923_14335 [Euzebyales bacterium]|nr:hypothetical protein [Euzebyales bacterium]
MNRRTVLATAGAITLVIVTGASAAAANLGLLNSATDQGAVGTLTPGSATSEPQTVVVEPAPATTTANASDAPATASVGPDHDREGREDDHHEAHEEYEGYEDDD